MEDSVFVGGDDFDYASLLPSPPTAYIEPPAAAPQLIPPEPKKRRGKRSVPTADEKTKIDLPPKKRCRKEKPVVALQKQQYELLLPDDFQGLDDVVLAQGTVPLMAPSDLPLPTVKAEPEKKKKKRLSPTVATETDPLTGEWVDVRVFDRNAVSITEAERLEMFAVVLPGTYFVSLARKRVRGMVDLHDRWLSRMSNRCSYYATVQRDLQTFFAEMLAEFDRRYASYIAHPAFETIGKIRRRTPSPASSSPTPN